MRHTLTVRQRKARSQGRRDLLIIAVALALTPGVGLWLAMVGGAAWPF